MKNLFFTFILVVCSFPIVAGPAARQLPAAESKRATAGGGGGGGACDTLNDSHMLAYYKLEGNSGGTWADSKGSFSLSDSGAHGTSTGVIGNAYNAGGNGALGRVSGSDLTFNLHDFSCSFWFNAPTPNGGGQFQALVGKGCEWAVYLNDTGQLVFITICGSGAGASLVSSATINASTWYHCVVTYDNANSLKWMYVNVATTNGTPVSVQVTTTGDPFQLSAISVSSSEAWLYTGLLDEVAVFDNVLTPTNVTNLYNAGVACRPSGL